MSGLLSDDYVDARAREMQIASLAKRVLFIGNSLTFWNQGVDVMLAKLVPGIETQRVAVGGATLETLWNNDEAKLAVADKDIVVLQEDLPETSRESFRRYAKLWCDHVRRNGAEPVFYAAWAYDRLPAFDDDAICAEHEKVAAENNARIAHVGARSLEAREGVARSPAGRPRRRSTTGGQGRRRKISRGSHTPAHDPCRPGEAPQYLVRVVYVGARPLQASGDTRSDEGPSLC